MSLPRRQIILFALWLAGLAIVCYYVPYGPRDGWQPADNERNWAVLNDNRTLVTTVRDESPRWRGPILLRDVETGDIVTSILGPEDEFDSVEKMNEWLVLIQTVEVPDDGIWRFLHRKRLRLIDPWTGEQKGEFFCNKILQGEDWWRSPKNGNVIAFHTIDNEGGRVEWRDVATGQLVRSLTGFPNPRKGFVHPIALSPDGKYFVGSILEEKATDDVESKIAVWEVSSGELKYEFPGPYMPLFTSFSFSPTGAYFVEGVNVRSTTSGEVLFTTKPMRSITFSADERWLMGIRSEAEVTTLVAYEVAAGKESAERTMTIPDCPAGYVGVDWISPDGNRVLVSGRTKIIPPSKYARHLPDLDFFDAFTRGGDVYGGFLLDVPSRSVPGASPVSCDGAMLDGRLTMSGTEIWNIPPRRPLRWLLLAWFLWSLPFITYAAWRLRKRRTSTREIPA